MAGDYRVDIFGRNDRIVNVPHGSLDLGEIGELDKESREMNRVYRRRLPTSDR